MNKPEPIAESNSRTERPSVTFAAALLATTLTTQYRDGFRNVLPEPVDVFDHLGNASPSMAAGLVFAHLWHVGSRCSGFSQGVHAWGRAAAGALLAAGLNVYGETAEGFVSDPLDCAYGMAAGMAAATFTYTERAAPGFTDVSLNAQAARDLLFTSVQPAVSPEPTREFVGLPVDLLAPGSTIAGTSLRVRAA